jgi:site-specific DNA-methyltransferase (adenine-specific)
MSLEKNMEINKIYNENCLDTMKRMPNNFLDATITSPPYDNLRAYKDGIGNEWSFNTFKPIAEELFRVTNDGGVVVWVVGDATIDGGETGSSFKQALYFQEIGFKIFDTMIYQKTGTPFPQKVRYNQIFEYMFVFSKQKPKTFNPILKPNITAGAVRNSRKFRNKDGELIAGMQGNKPIAEYGVENNIWVIKNGMYKSTSDLVAFQHPAIFPEELAQKHIQSWTNEGDIVYDPFMGSGTTAKKSIELNRNYIGSEISKEYYDISHERLKQVNFLSKFTNRIKKR